MSINTAQFPGAIWDGLSPTRISRRDDKPPETEDWDQIVAELIATQSDVGAGVGARVTAIEAIVVDVDKTIVLPNVTAPTVAADTFAMYASDQTAGNAVPHFKTENGQIIILFSGTGIADPTGGVTQDAEARTAIIALISRLEVNGLLLTV